MTRAERLRGAVIDVVGLRILCGPSTAGLDGIRGQLSESPGTRDGGESGIGGSAAPEMRLAAVRRRVKDSVVDHIWMLAV